MGPLAVKRQDERMDRTQDPPGALGAGASGGMMRSRGWHPPQPAPAPARRAPSSVRDAVGPRARVMSRV